jgi:YvrJ protein family
MKPGPVSIFLHSLYITTRKEACSVETILPLIQDVGFPIAVTFYLLYRIETKLDGVIQSIQNLPDKMKE